MKARSRLALTLLVETNGFGASACDDAFLISSQGLTFLSDKAVINLSYLTLN